MNLDYYQAVVERIRAKNTQLIINLTTGLGGRFVPGEEDPKVAGPGTTLIRPELRVAHVSALKPDICTLDLNTMTFGKEIVINTPPNVRRMAKIIRAADVKPEIELFDSGDIALLHDLVADGTLAGPLLCSLVLGVKYGFQATPETILYARDLLPADSPGRPLEPAAIVFPTVAQSYLAGGHVRVGLEDGIFIEKGVLAPSNASMVEKARKIIEFAGGAGRLACHCESMLGL